MGSEGEGARERGRFYEAYEVKNKRQKSRCLLLRRKKKNILRKTQFLRYYSVREPKVVL